MADTDPGLARRPRGRVWSNPLIYPCLFAVFPVMYLWSTNLNDQIDVASVFKVMAGVLIGTAFVWILARIALHDPHRASFATVCIVTPVLVFGHFLQWADPSGVRGSADPLLAAFGVLTLALVVVASRAPWVHAFAPGANLIAAILVAMNLIPIVSDAVRSPVLPPRDPVDLAGAAIDASGRPRDVYYLVFDRYGGEDILREQFGFDNSGFLQELARLGFDIADEPTANYPKTVHSLASSLNMGYLDDLAERVGTSSTDWDPLFTALDGPRAPLAFQDLGYVYVNVGSWFEPTSRDPYADVDEVFDPIDEFTNIFRSTTAWPSIARRTGLEDPEERQREAWAGNLEQLEVVARIADDPRPTFTFGHFFLPHPPYVSRPDGGFAASSDYDTVEDAYIAQLQATNLFILRLVGGLLTESEDSDPIVIVQSDEGPNPDLVLTDPESFHFTEAPIEDLERKLRILSAIYLPGVPSQTLPRTPVNTFRFILNLYYDVDIALLPERVFIYPDVDHPYEFHDVTGRLGLPEP